MCWGHLILMSRFITFGSGVAESLNLLLYIIFIHLFILYALPTSAVLSLFPVSDPHDKDVVDIPTWNK